MPRVIASSVEIDAPKERVWQIVRDTPRYPEWSPFLVAVEGDVRVGAPVVLVVRMHMNAAERPIRQTERVTRDEAGTEGAPGEIGWGIDGFFLTTERVQRVVPLGPGRCRYETTDAFSGVLAPLVLGLYAKRIQAGFDATARALKERAEQAERSG